MFFTKKYLFVLLSALSFTAVADEFTMPDYGLSYSGSGISFRKSIGDTSLAYAGIGLTGMQYDGHDDSTGVTTTFTLGARKYLTIDKLSKFVNLEMSRTRTEYSGNTPNYQLMNTATNINYGVEYFLVKNLSIEGSAGIGISWQEYTYPTYAYTYRSNTFPVGRLAVNYYW